MNAPTNYLETLVRHLEDTQPDNEAVLIIFRGATGVYNIDLGKRDPASDLTEVKDVDWMGYGPTLEDAARAALLKIASHAEEN